MVAYNFKKRFVPLIESRTKQQTIRARNNKRRHVRVGERVQLYFGQRTKHCRKLLQEDPTCIAVLEIDIDVGRRWFLSIRIQGKLLERRDWNQLAIDDGFEHAADMHAFWLKHRGTGKFQGYMIQWRAED